MERNDLHEYQNYCVDFLKTHPEAMLILEMGLGKSIQTIMFIKLILKEKPDAKIMIVVPTYNRAKHIEIVA